MTTKFLKNTKGWSEQPLPPLPTDAHPIFWYNSSRLMATHRYFANGPGGSEAQTGIAVLCQKKDGNKRGECVVYRCHNLNKVILCREEVFSSYQTSWFSLKLSSHPVPISQMAGLVNRWMYMSGQLGLYLSTLQSSPGASAVFVPFAFPILNYASEALPISIKGKKNAFSKNLLWVLSSSFLEKSCIFFN